MTNGGHFYTIYQIKLKTYFLKFHQIEMNIFGVNKAASFESF